MENKNIILAINKSILEMPAIGKDSKNPQGWNFRSIDAIVDYSRKIIASNGLIIIPETLNATSKVDLIEKQDWKTKEIRVSRLTTSSVLVKYNIYHTSGESLVAILPGESQDYADKSLSQAETFAFKSMLSKVFLLGFEEDADAKHTDTSTPKAEPKKETVDNSVLPRIEKKFKTLPESEKLTFLANAQKKLETENQDAVDYQKAFDWIVAEKNKIIVGAK